MVALLFRRVIVLVDEISIFVFSHSLPALSVSECAVVRCAALTFVAPAAPVPARSFLPRHSCDQLIFDWIRSATNDSKRDSMRDAVSMGQ